MKHVMFDSETLGLTAGHTPLSLGAVAFLPTEDGIADDCTFYMNIDRDSCAAAGLIEDPKTLDWWLEPVRAEAWAATQVDPRPLGEVLDAFDAFYRRWAAVETKEDRLWSNGPSFDEVIIGAAYLALKREAPWRYNAGRDCRTVYDMTGLKLQHTAGTFHHALDDAREQALLVQRGFGILGLAA